MASASNALRAARRLIAPDMTSGAAPSPAGSPSPGLCGRHPARVAAALTALATAALLLALVPVAFLLGHHRYWLHPHGDLAQSMTGAAYFVADRWRWPLLVVPHLGEPPGTNIAFTDSIPLVALLARAVRQVFGVQPVYHPMWVTLCFLAQGPALVTALRAAGIRDWRLLAVNGFMVVLLQPFITRFDHAALCGHFLILLAIAVALGSGARLGTLATAIFTGLALVSLLVHPYFAAMVLVIETMAAANGVWTGRMRPATSLAALSSTLAALFLAGALLEFFAQDTFTMRAYGDYALDLAAPWVPDRSGIFPERLLGISGNGELYVGAGVLLLWLLAARLTSWREVIDAQGGTLLVAVLLLAFALTYGVKIAGHLVLGVSAEKIRAVVVSALKGDGVLAGLRAQITALDVMRIAAYAGLLLGGAALFLLTAWRMGKHAFVTFMAAGGLALVLVAPAKPLALVSILTSFEASARFWWPLMYGLIVAAMIVIARRSTRPLAALSVCLAVQAVDSAPSLADFSARARVTPAVFIPDEDEVLALMRAADRVMILPTYLCANVLLADGPVRSRLVEQIVALQWLGARAGKPINSVRHARMSIVTGVSNTRGCATSLPPAKPPQPAGTLLIELALALPAGASFPAVDTTRCRRFSAGYLCLQ